jgi:endonuclease-3
VTQTLWSFVTCPQDVIALWHDRLHDMIRSVNYHNAKAKHIYETSQILYDQRSTNDELWYQIPQEIGQLTTLPWVGVKTAKVVLHVLFWQNRIAADTHVHRVANRLTWVRTSQPDKTSEQLEQLIPDQYKSIAHHSIILRWRYHCKAVKPHCDTCPLKLQCNWYTKNHKPT